MNAYYNDFLKRGSSKIIFVGTMYVLLGILALAFSSAVTVAAIITLGVVLVAVGAVEIVYGIQGRAEGQLWPHLTFGILALICGALMFLNPVGNAVGFTLIAAFLLVASGLAKVIGAVAARDAGWGWYAINGAISLCLGGLILSGWPLTAMWLVGTYIGIDLLLSGAAQIGLGVSIKKARSNLVDQTFSTLNPEPRFKNEYKEDHHPFH